MRRVYTRLTGHNIPTKNFPCGITPCYTTFFLLTAHPVCTAGVHRSWTPGCPTTTLYTVAPNICGSLLWHFFMSPFWLLDFWQICAPIMYSTSVATTVQCATEQTDSCSFIRKPTFPPVYSGSLRY